MAACPAIATTSAWSSGPPAPLTWQRMLKHSDTKAAGSSATLSVSVITPMAGTSALEGIPLRSLPDTLAHPAPLAPPAVIPTSSPSPASLPTQLALVQSHPCPHADALVALGPKREEVLDGATPHAPATLTCNVHADVIPASFWSAPAHRDTLRDNCCIHDTVNNAVMHWLDQEQPANIFANSATTQQLRAHFWADLRNWVRRRPLSHIANILLPIIKGPLVGGHWSLLIQDACTVGLSQARWRYLNSFPSRSRSAALRALIQSAQDPYDMPGAFGMWHDSMTWEVVDVPRQHNLDFGVCVCLLAISYVRWSRDRDHQRLVTQALCTTRTATDVQTLGCQYQWLLPSRVTPPGSSIPVAGSTILVCILLTSIPDTSAAPPARRVIFIRRNNMRQDRLDAAPNPD